MEHKHLRVLRERIFRPDLPDSKPNSTYYGLELIKSTGSSTPRNLLPILMYDDMSIACINCVFIGEDESKGNESIVRWHLGDCPQDSQGALLDTSFRQFLFSYSYEVYIRTSQLEHINKVAEKFKKEFTEKHEVPRSFIWRPIQLACQNVIIALAVISHESRFDGLQVHNYLTCDVPHLETFEGDRALLALILCDAFQNGGTMEVRFGRPPRSNKKSTPQFPPSLERYCRVLGIKIGAEAPYVLSPEESRELFLAVTPMSADLYLKVLDGMDRGELSPERICYCLLSGIWTEIELDFILSMKNGSNQLLEGYDPDFNRMEQLFGYEVARAAVMIGTLYRVLKNSNSIQDLSDNEIRVYEDSVQNIGWSISEFDGSIELFNADFTKITWTSTSSTSFSRQSDTSTIVVVPRALPLPIDFELVRKLKKLDPSNFVVLLSPIDTKELVPEEIPTVFYPDKGMVIDQEISKRLFRSSVGRK